MNPPQALVELDLKAIDTSFSRLRLVDPPAEARMLESVRRQGQLTPVVVGAVGDGVVLVDGFKRYRALRHLGGTVLKAHVLEMPVRGLKTAIVQLNGRKGLKSIEEAWVLQSLHQDDALTQEEIGVLMGRHKSWVCRRLALVERLCEEAQEHLHLGLISPRICRYLVQLPRGNQPRVLKCVIKHHLNSRELAQLVKLLQEQPSWNHETILWQPLSILDERVPPTPRALTGAAALLFRRLATLTRKAREALTLLPADTAASWSDEVRRKLTTEFEALEAVLTPLRGRLIPPVNISEEDF